MAQYQVYRLSGGQLVLDLQSDLIDTGSRVVAPLYPVGRGPKPLTRLEPILPIEGRDHVLHTAELAALPAASLRTPALADLSAHDYDIRRALDMLFTGF